MPPITAGFDPAAPGQVMVSVPTDWVRISIVEPKPMASAPVSEAPAAPVARSPQPPPPPRCPPPPVALTPRPPWLTPPVKWQAYTPSLSEARWHKGTSNWAMKKKARAEAYAMSGGASSSSASAFQPVRAIVMCSMCGRGQPSAYCTKERCGPCCMRSDDTCEYHRSQ